MKPNLLRTLIACGFATAALFAFTAHTAAAETKTFGNAQWIWSGKRGESNRCFCEKTFKVRGEVERATLRAVTDHATAYVYLYPRPSTVERTTKMLVDDFSYPQEWDVGPSLYPFTFCIDIAATASDGPAAVAVHLEIRLKDGTTQTIDSDETWQWRNHTTEGVTSRTYKTVSYGPVAADPWTDLSPDIAISPFDNYEQWQQAKGTEQQQATDAAKFQVADGFEIELVKSAGLDEGSWVSIACDPKGRFVIGREDQGLLRLTLPGPNADRSAIQVETINDTLKECRGLLFAHDSLYAVANESQGVYRLRDRDGDDKFELVEELFKFPGKPGHGRNGLALAPDGRIHLICGDSVELPTGVVDRTSPFTEHRRGEKTKEGFVLAFDADGKHPEILVTGMRNPYGIAFNEQGDSFTYDADPEFDMGSPWYKSTRVLQLSPGSDFGWRGVTGQWPPHFPDHADNAPFTLDIGKGSPTAVLFGTGNKFPPRYQKALYILDWAYGRIVAIDLEPRGAGYSGKATTFCKGRPFNVTSLCFGPDGAMYVVTGGRKTQAGLYRIRYTGQPQTEPDPTSQQIARRDHAAEQREVRRKLESWFVDHEAFDLDFVTEVLGGDDPQLDFAARTALEHQPYSKWRDVMLLRTDDHGTRVKLLTAAIREGTPQSLALVQEWLPIVDLNKLTQAERDAFFDLGRRYMEVAPTKSIGLTLDTLHSRIERNESAGISIAEARLRALDTRESGLLRYGLHRIDRVTTQWEQMLYLYLLRDHLKAGPPEFVQRYFSALAQARHWQGGEGMPRFIQRITDDALAAVPEAERAKYAAMVTPEAQAADDSPLLQTRDVLRAWKADDVPSILSASSDAKPDLVRGKEMFAAALCIRCHRFGTSGHAVGPDLTGLARRFSRRDMLEHVIVPSKVIAEQYRTVQIETSDGRLVVGRILSEGDFRSQKLRIATNPLDPRQVIEVAKSDIESHTMTNTSLMPEGLLNTLNEAEIRDLLAYLETAALAP